MYGDKITTTSGCSKKQILKMPEISICELYTHIKNPKVSICELMQSLQGSSNVENTNTYRLATGIDIKFYIVTNFTNGGRYIPAPILLTFMYSYSVKTCDPLS